MILPLPRVLCFWPRLGRPLGWRYCSASCSPDWVLCTHVASNSKRNSTPRRWLQLCEFDAAIRVERGRHDLNLAIGDAQPRLMIVNRQEETNLVPTRRYSERRRFLRSHESLRKATNLKAVY